MITVLDPDKNNLGTYHTKPVFATISALNQKNLDVTYHGDTYLSINSENYAGVYEEETGHYNNIRVVVVSSIKDFDTYSSPNGFVGGSTANSLGKILGDQINCLKKRGVLNSPYDVEVCYFDIKTMPDQPNSWLRIVPHHEIVYGAKYIILEKGEEVSKRWVHPEANESQFLDILSRMLLNI